MRSILFIFFLAPLMTFGQTTKQKVLYMKVVRTAGSISAKLEGDEDFIGPVYNLETKRLMINGSSRTLSTIKEIRFEIKEEEVPDGICDMQNKEEEAGLYDLSGRKVGEGSVQRGMYIKGGKKIVKK